MQEVLLVKTYIEKKQVFIQAIRAEYSNQQVDYTITEQLDFTAYEAALPEFSNQAQYNSKIEERGSFRKNVKNKPKKWRRNFAAIEYICERSVQIFLQICS